MPADGADLATVQELRSVDILSFFDQELRPIFCLDTAGGDGSAAKLEPIFQNTFLRVSGLWAKLVPPPTPMLPEDDPAYDFIRWAWSAYDAEVESSRFTKHEGIHWSKTTLLDRWRVVTGTFCADPVHAPSVDSARNRLEKALGDARDGLLRGVVDQGYRELSTPDAGAVRHESSWAIDRGHVVGTPAPGDLKLDSHGLDDPAGYPFSHKSGDWLDGFDWDSTALGPRRSWDPQLKRLAKLLMADPWPAAAYWGPQKNILYNEQYRWIIGRKHPEAMGKPFAEVWGEVDTAFRSIFEKATAERRAVSADDTEFHIERDGFIEQTYFSWSMMPITDDDDDEVVGYYNPSRETTVQKTLYRRMSLLLALSQKLGLANAVADFWPQVVDALDVGAHDIPFLLMYGADDLDGDYDELFKRSQHEVKRWELRGTIGYPKDVRELPTYIDCDRPTEDMVPLVSRIRTAREPVLLSTTDGSFPSRLMTTIHTRSFGENCSKAVLCPIRPYMAHSSASAGFIVIGLNPRRPYDDDYKVFVQLLTRQMASSLAAVLLFADAIRRGERKASALSRQLATQTKIAEDNELRFQRIADHAPVAIFKIAADGRLEYGNEDYFDMTGTGPDDDTPFAYRKCVEDEHQGVVARQWEDITANLGHVSDEIRLKKRWTSPDGTVRSTWAVQAAYPELDTDGKLVGVLGCLTDISRQKWAEEVQARRTEHALELKRQQEMFIDMTSHELRNPLSAVIQCADSIISSFDRPGLGTRGKVCIDASDAAGAVDAAQTIIFCAQHQKRISDDVLILSKLNSDLVLITPVDVRPAEVIRTGLRVFDRELKKSGIRLSVRAEPSYDRLRVDSVRLDPSRTLQVLINLVSNAIKFTVSRRRREIDVRFGASLTTDIEELRHLRFWDQGSKSTVPGSGSGSGSGSDSSGEWGDGEVVYMFVSIRDTGHGLRHDEMDHLFQRFSQASPRTHVQYGGSGLGLFISKRLVEAQGGAIGVSSAPNKGSTFAFYVKARRSPSGAVPQLFDVPVSDAVLMDEKQQVQVSIAAAAGDSRSASEDGDGNDGDDEDNLSPAARSSPLSPMSLPPPSPPGVSSSQIDTQKTGMHDGGEDGKTHVLIVEDNLVNQKVLAKQLEKAGYAVAVANHGGEALSHLRRTTFWKEVSGDKTEARTGQSARSLVRRHLSRRESSSFSAESDYLGLSSSDGISRSSSFGSDSSGGARAEEAMAVEAVPELKLDIVLMDLEMPVMDGITCVRRIRELQNHCGLARFPVIAVTANARPEQISAAMEAGMDGVVCKPFRIPQLTKEIQAMLKRTAEEGG